MPLALDSRLPLDCLFMIFEEDFRFWPVNQDPDLIDYDKRVMSLLKFRKERASSSNQGSLPPLEEDTPLPPWRSTKRRGQEKPEGRFFSSATRGSSEPTAKDEGYTENVADLVRWATVAHREGCGNLVWIGWVPHKKPSHMHHGGHCLLLSKDGMVKVAEAMGNGGIAKGHIDLKLRCWLQQPGVSKDVGACYIFPPLGGYIQHESGCDPQQYGSHTAGRPSLFDDGNPAYGTRVAHDPKHRTKWLIQFAPKAADRVWIATPDDATLASDECLWRSVREPTASDSEDDQSEAATSIDFSPDDEEDEWKKSKRYKRGERQFNLRQRFRHWVQDGQKAGVVV